MARRLLPRSGSRRREIWSYREQNARASPQGILERARDRPRGGDHRCGDAGHLRSRQRAGRRGARGRRCRRGAARPERCAGRRPALRLSAAHASPSKAFRRDAAFGAPRALRRCVRHEATSIWYESPQRIRASLGDLAAIAPDARIFLVREYTKLHEQQLLGTPPEVAAALPDPVRGEIAFAIAPLLRGVGRERRCRRPRSTRCWPAASASARSQSNSPRKASATATRSTRRRVGAEGRRGKPAKAALNRHGAHLLRHHADLLHQRQSAYRPRLHDDRRRHARAHRAHVSADVLL